MAYASDYHGRLVLAFKNIVTPTLHSWCAAYPLHVPEPLRFKSTEYALAMVFVCYIICCTTVLRSIFIKVSLTS